jgi:hypothetical protein
MFPGAFDAINPSGINTESSLPPLIKTSGSSLTSVTMLNITPSTDQVISVISSSTLQVTSTSAGKSPSRGSLLQLAAVNNIKNDAKTKTFSWLGLL